MTKFLTTAVVALVMPVAASASINLSAAVVTVNKDMAITSGSTFGAGAGPGVHANDDPTPCFGGVCGDPVGCPTSPENPTMLLGLIGGTGLLLGRFGYTRLRSRRTLPTIAAA